MEQPAENPFANVALSPDAKRLANAIYNTYIQEKYPYIEISVKRLYQMFCGEGRSHPEGDFQYLFTLFFELNEPIALHDFKYGAKVYPWKVVQFCDLQGEWKPEDEFIEIHLNEIYLAAMKVYMDEPFLPLRSKE